MGRKTKLEPPWIGKGDQPRLELRSLLEERETSYHADSHVTDEPLSTVRWTLM